MRALGTLAFTTSGSRIFAASFRAPAFARRFGTRLCSRWYRANHRDRLFYDAVDRARKTLSRTQVHTLFDFASVGRADFARGDRMEMDSRLHLQRDHMGVDRASCL